MESLLKMDTKDDIIRVCNATRDLLIKKNKAYGDSALSPLAMFGSGDPIVSLGARMDDKLMRLRSLGIGIQTIDTLYDLHGYLTLLLIAIERKHSIDSSEQIVQDDSNTTTTINSNEEVRTKSNDVPIGVQDRHPVSHYFVKSTQSDTGWSEFGDHSIS